MLRQPGLSRPAGKWALQAVGIGILLVFLVPVLLWLTSLVVPSAQEGSADAVAQGPWWFMLLAVVTAAVTEEILYRAYPLERNAAHVLAVPLPLGAALTALYLWRRNLVVTMIAHFMIDLPLVIVAMTGV